MSHIHIPDGVLPFWLWGGGWLVALVMVTVAGKVSARDSMRRKVPLLGVVAALMLVSMSSEIIPIAYHVNLTVIAGVLLGPWLAIIAAFVVEVILAMLGHGGVTVVGLNTIVVSIEMILGWALFGSMIRMWGKDRVKTSAAISTVVTLATTTTLLVGIVWLAGGGMASARETGALDPAELKFENPFTEGVFSVGLLSGGEEHAADGHGDASAEEETGLSVARFAAVVYTLGPIGWALEAAITAAVLGYVARVRPTLIFSGALTRSRRHIPGDETGGA